jgi:hypothetical protein
MQLNLELSICKDAKCLSTAQHFRPWRAEQGYFISTPPLLCSIFQAVDPLCRRYEHQESTLANFRCHTALTTSKNTIRPFNNTARQNSSHVNWENRNFIMTLGTFYSTSITYPIDELPLAQNKMYKIKTFITFQRYFLKLLAYIIKSLQAC